MDYRKLAADELRRVEGLRAASQICRDRLREMDSALTSLPALNRTDPVQGSGGNHTEEYWLSLIAAKTEEEDRLRTVVRALRRFERAWETLDEDGREVLREFYVSCRKGAADRISDRMHCDARTAHRWKDDALVAFTRAFYGVVVT